MSEVAASPQRVAPQARDARLLTPADLTVMREFWNAAIVGRTADELRRVGLHVAADPLPGVAHIEMPAGNGDPRWIRLLLACRNWHARPPLDLKGLDKRVIDVSGAVEGTAENLTDPTTPADRRAMVAKLKKQAAALDQIANAIYAATPDGQRWGDWLPLPDGAELWGVVEIVSEQTT